MPKLPIPQHGSALQKRRLVNLGASIANPVGRSFFRLIEKPIERLFSLSALNQFYSDIAPTANDRTFFTTVLRHLRVGYDLVPEDIAKVPTLGPLIVVANHPFGGLDGLIMGDILTQIRPDFRLLANRLLQAIPELEPWVSPLDAFGGSDSPKRNLPGLRQAIRWLEGGGALGVFPAGTVSHLHLRYLNPLPHGVLLPIVKLHVVVPDPRP